MMLDVERHRGVEPVAAEQRQMHRLPADMGADAIGGFQRMQKGVLHEGRIAGQGVPGVGRQVGHSCHDADDCFCGFGFRRGGLCFKMHVLASFHRKTMNLHEYQAKQILRSGNINTPRGIAAASAEAAADAARELGGDAWVVKAQIHAGGRGKAGGVKVVKTLDDVRAMAASLLGKSLVTNQNAPDGQPVNQVLVEETLPIARELYLSLLVDRETERVAIVASAAGGMDIEEVAHATPEKVLTETCDPLLGVQDFQCRALAFALELTGEAYKDFCRLLPQLVSRVHRQRPCACSKSTRWW